MTASWTATDHAMMARALELARNGLYTTHPNPRVGCIVVQAEEVVGEGWHARAGEPHAEVHALKDAGDQAKGATVYVTLEPCCHHGRTPPCTLALLDAGVARVVVACEDPFDKMRGKGLALLRDQGVEVEVGLLQEAAQELNVGFFTRMRHGRPWIRLKLASSLDGITALSSGESQWITGPAAREHGHTWRARASAILTGIGTVLADDPQLNVRTNSAESEPVRIVLDTRGRLPETAKLLRQPGETWVLSAPDVAREKPDDVPGVRWLPVPEHAGRLDLQRVVALLADLEINELHVEAGATLSGNLFAAGLVDELLIYQAPCVIGEGKPILEGLKLDRLADKVMLQQQDMRMLGQDVFRRLKVVRS